MRPLRIKWTQFFFLKKTGFLTSSSHILLENIIYGERQTLVTEENETT